MSPTSGFHHATYFDAMGFCTFNGLMIAAIKLKRAGLVDRVGIVDLDAHFANGTAHIIDHLNIDYVEHLSLGAMHARYFDDWSRFLSDMPILLRDRFSKVDLLLYQAGADAHIDDPAGGYFSTAQLKARDRIVFTFSGESGIPVVWNLAGGYQSPLEMVLKLHQNTLNECIEVLF